MTPIDVAAATATAIVGVTPQGLGVGISVDDAWTWLGIGHTGAPSPEPDLRFTSVKGKFREAMQTNNLFLVLGHCSEFVADDMGSVAYLLTDRTIDIIGTLPEPRIPAGVLDAIRSALADKHFDRRGPFVAALGAAAPSLTKLQRELVLRYAGQLTPVVGGWPFRLSPDSWGATTFLIMKFVLGRSITDLVDDLSTWAWPEASKTDPTEAQAGLRDMIDAARQAVGHVPTSPYADFLSIVDDPNWTGVLGLDVEVPVEQLPAELQVLAAGIDPTGFRAHHFGLSATPYCVGPDGALRFERSSMFGLIDYVNPEDQYFTEDVAYAFRVMQLTVAMRNSVVTGFTSRAELLINRLFGAEARLLPTQRGNNVMLDGALQQQRLSDGSAQDTYVFSMSDDSFFQVDGGVLRSVELVAVQLATVANADPVSGSATVDAVFLLSGNLRFVDPEGFDPFAWGPKIDTDGTSPVDSYLRFGNLAVGMAFQLGDPVNTTAFTLQDGNLSFDAANSVARVDSLVAGFPIRLSSLIATADPELSPATPRQTPADLGYVAISAPFEQSKLTWPWYGLDYTIDLGTLGALAGGTVVALHVLVAWSPDDGAYLGVGLPGVGGRLGPSLSLQGVVTMGFKGIELLSAPGDEALGSPRTYTFRLRDFALRMLGVALPPGHNDVILFGNPDQGGSSKVGWYLAYASDADPKRPSAPPTRAAVARLQPALRGLGG